MMKNKKIARLNRAKRIRIKLKYLNYVRLCVYRTSKHIYAQVISANRMNVLTAASTTEYDIKLKCKYTGNIESAKIIGKIIANRCKKIGIIKVAFDRSGYKYHGRIKALAESARSNGLIF